MINKKGLTGNVVTDVALWIVFILIGMTAVGMAVWLVVKRLTG